MHNVHIFWETKLINNYTTKLKIDSIHFLSLYPDRTYICTGEFSHEFHAFSNHDIYTHTHTLSVRITRQQIPQQTMTDTV